MLNLFGRYVSFSFNSNGSQVSWLSQGQYCGGQIGCERTYVYECSPTGETCEYGYRISCACCSKTCLGQSPNKDDNR
ncbi:16822_t:CDS:2, partial [Entrophospora sp. SA101]